LAAKYGEFPIGLGLRGPSIVEIYVSRDLSTWTILQTNPSGMSCVIAEGTDFMPGIIRPAGDPL